MAEIEQVGLLIDGDTLYGVAASSGVPAQVQSWRFSSEAAAPEEVESQKSEVESPEPSNRQTVKPSNELADERTDDSTVQRSNGSTVALVGQVGRRDDAAVALYGLLEDEDAVDDAGAGHVEV